MIDNAVDDLNEFFKTMLEYEKVKDRLYVRIQKDCDMGDTPVTRILDWVVTYHIMLGEPEDKMLLSGQVSKSLFDSFGVSLERMHNDALLSSQRLFPASCERMLDVLMPNAGYGFNSQLSDGNGFEMLVITNRRRSFGASSILYPEMLKRIYEQFNDEFYILPSSVHEVLAVPARDKDPDELAQIVRAVNRAEVIEEEQLSDHVYHYSLKTDCLEIAA